MSVEFGLMHFGVMIRTGRPHVAGLQTPCRRGEYGGCHLSSEANFARDGIRFAVPCRELCQPQYDVRRVLSNACEIYDGNGHDAKAYLISRLIQKEKSCRPGPQR